ncbi:unnamed protein product [Heterobilharzia americana]|nr:unnamed protein product [Heterobilharzia americana]
MSCRLLCADLEALPRSCCVNFTKPKLYKKGDVFFCHLHVYVLYPTDSIDAYSGCYTLCCRVVRKDVIC